jgi:hypothetical protein
MEEKNNNFAILALVAIVAVVGVISLVMMAGGNQKTIDTPTFVVDDTMAGQAVKYNSLNVFPNDIRATLDDLKTRCENEGGMWSTTEVQGGTFYNCKKSSSEWYGLQ